MRDQVGVWFCVSGVSLAKRPRSLASEFAWWRQLVFVNCKMALFAWDSWVEIRFTWCA